MFFLLRMAFWIGLVLVLLPTGKTQDASHAPQVGATEAVTAATAAMSDLGGFCTRQPAACDIGGQAATVIGQRAQAGARKVFEFISEKADKSDKAETKTDPMPDAKSEPRPDIKAEAKVDTKMDAKAAAKPEAKADRKPIKAAKKTPDHTGSIPEMASIDTGGAPAFDNTAAHGAPAPDWTISTVETIFPLLP